MSSARLSALGQSPGQVRRLVVSGTLVRLRRSSFVDGDRWRAASPWERHELRARAVATSLCVPGSPYALSHHSALCVMGVGVYAVDERVHLLRTDGRRGRGDDTLHVHPPVPPRWVSPHRGLPVVRPELACLQVAAAFGVVAGLVSTDAALRQDLVDRAALEAARPLVVAAAHPVPTPCCSTPRR